MHQSICYGQFTPTMQLNWTQLNCRKCGWQCNDVISIVTSRCCAQTTHCLQLNWVELNRLHMCELAIKLCSRLSTTRG